MRHRGRTLRILTTWGRVDVVHDTAKQAGDSMDAVRDVLDGKRAEITIDHGDGRPLVIVWREFLRGADVV